MTATGDNDGGVAVWPVAGGFVRLRPSDEPRENEQRVFTVGRAIAMLVFVREVQEAVRGVEGRIDDPHGRLRAAFLGTIMQAEARYRERLG